MTLVLTVQTPSSIWLVADRRISAPCMTPIDDAIKVTDIDVPDGRAIFGYAGLGATAAGSQPSFWMSNVLRGRRHTLEQSLQIVANAMKREFPPHMDGIRDTRLRQHCFLIPAFKEEAHRLYSIDMVHRDGDYRYRYTRHIVGGSLTPLQVTVPIGIAGSGIAALLPFDRWKRPLLRLVKAYNRKKVKGGTVAQYLARIVYKAHVETKDGTVGPDSLVVWRNSRKGLYKGGGGHGYFSSGEPSSGGRFPSITNGMNLNFLAEIIADELTPQMEKRSEARKKGLKLPEFDAREKEVNERFSKLPSTPDEKLR